MILLAVTFQYVDGSPTPAGVPPSPAGLLSQREINKRSMTTPHRILVVEDNELLRQLLVRLLRGSGYEVVEAENGRTALKRIEEWRADLVITDMVMPHMDGLELIRILRRHYPDVKIVAMSENGLIPAETHLRVARLLGTHKVLVKPVCAREFLGTIHGLMGAG